MCISLRIDVNILNAQGATPLHLTQSPEVIEVCINHSDASMHIHTHTYAHRYVFTLIFTYIHACILHFSTEYIILFRF